VEASPACIVETARFSAIATLEHTGKWFPQKGLQGEKQQICSSTGKLEEFISRIGPSGDLMLRTGRSTQIHFSRCTPGWQTSCGKCSIFGPVFGKVDVAFGDDLSGVGGKAGMRVAW
jgi:hypothetical protein